MKMTAVRSTPVKVDVPIMDIMGAAADVVLHAADLSNCWIAGGVVHYVVDDVEHVGEAATKHQLEAMSVSNYLRGHWSEPL